MFDQLFWTIGSTLDVRISLPKRGRLESADAGLLGLSSGFERHLSNREQRPIPAEKLHGFWRTLAD